MGVERAANVFWRASTPQVAAWAVVSYLVR